MNERIVESAGKLPSVLFVISSRTESELGRCVRNLKPSWGAQGGLYSVVSLVGYSCVASSRFRLSVSVCDALATMGARTRPDVVVMLDDDVAVSPVAMLSLVSLARAQEPNEQGVRGAVVGTYPVRSQLGHPVDRRLAHRLIPNCLDGLFGYSVVGGLGCVAMSPDTYQWLHAPRLSGEQPVLGCEAVNCGPYRVGTTTGLDVPSGTWLSEDLFFSYRMAKLGVRTELLPIPLVHRSFRADSSYSMLDGSAPPKELLLEP